MKRRIEQPVAGIVLPLEVSVDTINRLLPYLSGAINYWGGVVKAVPTWEEMNLLNKNVHILVLEYSKELEKIPSEWKPDWRSVLGRTVKEADIDGFRALHLTAQKIRKGFQTMTRISQDAKHVDKQQALQCLSKFILGTAEEPETDTLVQFALFDAILYC